DEARMNANRPDRVGFLGLGKMGLPMAGNILRGGVPLTVWNRSVGALDEARRRGAEVASSATELFARTDVVVVMLADHAAIDAVLFAEPGEFAVPVRGKLVVNAGTVA